MDWDKLRIFHAVADAGSLTHAGDTLRLLPTIFEFAVEATRSRMLGLVAKLLVATL